MSCKEQLVVVVIAVEDVKGSLSADISGTVQAKQLIMSDPIAGSIFQSLAISKIVIKNKCSQLESC